MERFTITVDATDVVGYWHWPAQRGDRCPVIVMGHGFAAEWRFGSAGFIRAFNAIGAAVVTFDYRHFGESGGEPRTC